MSWKHFDEDMLKLFVAMWESSFTYLSWVI